MYYWIGWREIEKIIKQIKLKFIILWVKSYGVCEFFFKCWLGWERKEKIKIIIKLIKIYVVVF